jgi:hypothetical protein
MTEPLSRADGSADDWLTASRADRLHRQAMLGATAPYAIKRSCSKAVRSAQRRDRSDRHLKQRMRMMWAKDCPY